MEKRFALRARYMEGWYELNADKLVSSVTDDFIFDDPAEPEPVTKAGLAAYMKRWDERTRALGSTNEWSLSHEMRQDKDGILTDWEWWELHGANLQGSAYILTSDDGVMLEKITYFDRDKYR